MRRIVCHVADLSASFGPMDWFASHRTTCLSCQATAARTQRLRRELRSLRTVVVNSPRGLRPAVLSRIDARGPKPPARRILSRQRLVAAGGTVAAGITTAALLLRRHSQPVA